MINYQLNSSWFRKSDYCPLLATRNGWVKKKETVRSRDWNHIGQNATMKMSIIPDGDDRSISTSVDKCRMRRRFLWKVKHARNIHVRRRSFWFKKKSYFYLFKAEGWTWWWFPAMLQFAEQKMKIGNSANFNWNICIQIWKLAWEGLSKKTGKTRRERYVLGLRLENLKVPNCNLTNWVVLRN